jgi:nucleoside-diphosphate-sugar epimerase
VLRIDAVVNVPAADPTAEYNPRASHEMNTWRRPLARLCKAHGVPLRPRLVVLDLRLRVVDERADVLQDETSPVTPRAPYSVSKYEAERAILAMTDDTFCPVALRKGTVYGYSPRMRYDLVVNTFVRDALTKGRLTLHHGGEMWRPLVDVRDAAQAYVALVEAEEAAVQGEIFNLCYQNLRISELALRCGVAPPAGDRRRRPARLPARERAQLPVSGDKIARS